MRRGEKHLFMGLELRLDGAVFAPRAETALLGERAVGLLGQISERSPLVIDMCCGSGNLTCVLARARADARVLAADLGADAVATARRNAEQLGLQDRVQVFQGDLFQALEQAVGDDRAAIIVCNPPYISTAKLMGESASLMEEDPREAFDGGPYGISILQRLVREAPSYLKQGGYLLFEFGHGQDRQARLLLSRSAVFEPLDFVQDAEGHDRVAVARFTGGTRP